MSSKEFLDNVRSGDLMMVRSALLDDLIIDRTFRLFDEDFKLANERLDLMVPFDGKNFETDSGKWDMEYLNQQKVALMINFSEERIVHLKAVIAKVMPPGLSRDGSTVMPYETHHDCRTGRTVRSERVVVHETEKNEVNSRTTKMIISKLSSRKEDGCTGRRVNNVINCERDILGDVKSESNEIGEALIIGGIAATAVGIAIAKPIVIGAGIATAGVGICVKASIRR